MKEYPREQIEALDKSIHDKWEKIVNGKKEDNGVKDCPLCIINPFAGSSCGGCIIKEETGRACCHGIEYDKFIWHIDEKHKRVMDNSFNGWRVYCKECKDLAMTVLENLKKIRDNVCVKEEKKYFFRITENKIPIGDGGRSYLYIENEDGNKISYIATLDKTGIWLRRNVKEDIGLSLDEERRILVRKE